MDILEKAKNIEKWVVDARRELHMYPEASMEEFRTAEFIVNKLVEMGVAVTRVGKTGVVGVIVGKSAGKVVALRADMDALSIQEETGLDFSSQNPGMMHACGHDAHVAMLLGAAKLLMAERENIVGTIKLIFQPAEEIAAGAKMMIAEGVLQNPAVDMIFAMHVWPEITVGKVAVQEGLFMASGDLWNLTVKGVAAHGSTPWQGVDAITCSSAIVQSLQTIVSRMSDAREPVVVNVGTINGGERFNVIPGKVEMTGMNRAFTHETRNKLPIWLEDIIKNTCSAYRCEYDLKYELICGPMINDQAVTKFVRQAITPVFGVENILPWNKIMASEDFSEFAAKVPGMLILLGVGYEQEEKPGMLHSNFFSLNEEALKYGVAAYTKVAMEYLVSEKKV